MKDAILVQGSRMDKVEQMCSVILSKLSLIENHIPNSSNTNNSQKNDEDTPTMPILLVNSSDDDGKMTQQKRMKKLKLLHLPNPCVSNGKENSHYPDMFPANI